MSDEAKTIHLEQFLKRLGVAATGGDAKMLIQNGEVRVNKTVETRRKRQLITGDKVQIGNETFVVSDLR
jgi:ribosome-associated protein